MVPRDALMAELRRALQAHRPDAAEGLLREIELRLPDGSPAHATRAPALPRSRLLDEIAGTVRAAFPDRAEELLVALAVGMWPYGVIGPVTALGDVGWRDRKAGDVEPEGYPSFVVTAPDPSEHLGLRLLLHRDSMILGRATGLADFALHESSIARRHLMINQDALGRVLVEDLGSANGLYVNGKRTDWTWVYDGDEVVCGALGMKFVAALTR